MSGFGQSYRDEIRNMAGLLAEGRKEEALSGLDNMNWRKIHNISAIVQASEIYEACGRVEDAKDLLLMAHERSPIGRVVLYHLCMLCIRQGEYDEAKRYYEDYVEIAPHDFQKLVLKFHLAKARGADEYTLIAILEELKENEFVDEWAYQLAFLYHKTGQIDKSMVICDEIALYYGDGPYVEKALELKMLYHPLNEEQESQYRKIRGLKEEGDDGKNQVEIDYHPIKKEIPVPERPQGKFDTINLQAEIKKNIDEIMQATKTGEVDETMENIENLVGEFPFVKMDEKEEPEEKKEEKTSSIMEHYQKFLDEEYDGQMSLAIPDFNVADPQIAGQMTIDEVMSNWEKTKRAAEAALEESDKERLEKSKEEALKKANHIMDRLEMARVKLESGTMPDEIMKEEVLSKEGSEAAEEVAENIGAENPDWKKGVTFTIPKVGKSGVSAGVGLEIPVVNPAGDPETKEKKAGKEASGWNPPSLDQEENAGQTESIKALYQDAARIMEDVNSMLQEEIEKCTEGEVAEVVSETVKEEPAGVVETEVPETEVPETEVPEAEVSETADDSVKAETDTKDEAFAEESESETEADSQGDKEIETDAESTEELTGDSDTSESNDEAEEEDDDAASSDDGEPDSDINNPYQETPDLMTLHVGEETTQISADIMENMDMKEGDDEALLAETLLSKENEKKNLREKEKQAERDSKERMDLNQTVVLEQLGDEVRTAMNESIVQEEPVEKDDEPGYKAYVLSENEKELYSYFLPIPDMEKNICNALAGARDRLEKKNAPAISGNILISGGHGSGKTTMAKALILTLQNAIDRPGNNIGRIDADKLNGKNIQNIYEKIKGGCLVIEQAGDLKKETAISLSLFMNNDREGTLLILEDTKAGIKRAIGLDSTFADKFTESIDIPIFTIDELVTFGIKYASDEGYIVDEMGKLAMYDRITKEQRGDKPMYLKDIIDIMDEAIERASAKGFFKRRKVDDEGRPILIEKDFL